MLNFYQRILGRGWINNQENISTSQYAAYVRCYPRFSIYGFGKVITNEVKPFSEVALIEPP